MNAKKVYQFLNETGDPFMAIKSQLRALGYNDTEADFILSEYMNNPDTISNVGLSYPEIAKKMANRVMKDLQK